MTETAKISPSFDQFFADSGPNDTREAIVLYRPPEQPRRRVRGRLKSLKAKRDRIRAFAEAKADVHDRVIESYERRIDGRVKEEQSRKFSEQAPRSLPVAPVEVTQRSLAALAEQEDVLAVMPNQNVRLIAPKEVEYDVLARTEVRDGLTWGLKSLDILEIWETTKGENVNVAVLDTGVHGDHPALAGRVRDFVVVDPLGRRIEAIPTFDGGRHGTHVSGTIAGAKTPDGVSIGVAPEAGILAAGVLIGDATLRTLIEGIDWAIDRGADIINMSLGFTYYEPLFAQVFDLLIGEFDIVPVVAIGNENHGNTSSPGNAYNSLSVAAVEKHPRNRIEIAGFSSGASLSFPGTADPLVVKPDVAAPGVQVYSSIPPVQRPDRTYEYTYMDGTSMATPHVSGVAALLMSARPDASAADIIQALKDTARHPDPANRPDNRWGYGMIQPAEAMNVL